MGSEGRPGCPTQPAAGDQEGRAGVQNQNEGPREWQVAGVSVRETPERTAGPRWAEGPVPEQWPGGGRGATVKLSVSHRHRGESADGGEAEISLRSSRKRSRK